jgi:hypothetical protein
MKRLLNPLISLFSIILVLGLGEVVVRFATWDFRLHNYWLEESGLFQYAYPASFDSELGWSPRPDFSSTENAWQTQVSINARGLRANGSAAADSDSIYAVLACGDSFTFGDQVSDHETWPSYLQVESGLTVANAGVFGYGLDQSFLRMKKLAWELEPVWLILSMIPDDVERCELAERSSAGKPYFRLDADGLELMQEHIEGPESRQSGIRYILGWSKFCSRLLYRAFPEWWLTGVWQSRQVHEDGWAVAEALLREYAALAGDIPSVQASIVLLQYEQEIPEEDRQNLIELKAALKDEPLIWVDLYEGLEAIRRNDPEKHNSFFLRHMTATGNQWVARELRNVLSQIPSDSVHLSPRQDEALEVGQILP